MNLFNIFENDDNKPQDTRDSLTKTIDKLAARYPTTPVDKLAARYPDKQVNELFLRDGDTWEDVLNDLNVFSDIFGNQQALADTFEPASQPEWAEFRNNILRSKTVLDTYAKVKQLANMNAKLTDTEVEMLGDVVWDGGGGPVEPAGHWNAEDYDWLHELYAKQYATVEHLLAQRAQGRGQNKTKSGQSIHEQDVKEWEDTAPGHDRNQTELTPVEEAGSPAQQAAIAINMKKHNQKPKTDESYPGDTNYTYTVFIDGTKEGTYGSQEEARAVVRRKKEQAPGRDYRIAPKPRTSAASVRRFQKNRDRSIDEEELDEKKLGQFRPKLGTGHDIGKSVKKFRAMHGLDETEGKLKVSPHDAGMHAAVKDKPYDSNPHPKGSKEHLEWSKGHNAMRARKAQDLDEVKADPTGSWVVHNGSKVIKFKTHNGATAYAEKNGGKVASSEFYADKVQNKVSEHGGGGDTPRQWHAYVRAHRTDEASVNPQFIVAQVTKLLATEARRVTNAPMAQLLAPVMKEYNLSLQQIDGMMPGGLKRAAADLGIMMKEGWSNKMVARRTGQAPTPYSVYISGKEWKSFPDDDYAENVANKLRAKFKAEGRDPSVITIAPTDYDKGMDEGSMSSAAHHHTGPEFTGYWKGTDSATPGDKMVGAAESKEMKVPAARNFVAKNMKSAGAGQHKDAKRAMKQGDVKHKGQRVPMDEFAMLPMAVTNLIQKAVVPKPSEELQSISSMREGSDNLTKVSTEKLQALWNQHKDEQRPSPALAMKLKAVARELQRRKSVNFMEWAVTQGSRFNNFAGNPEVYAAAKAAYIAEGFGTSLANVSSKISGHPRKMKTAQQIRNKATKFAPQPIAETDVEEDYVSEIKKGQKDSNGNTTCWDGYHADGTKPGKNGPVRNCVKNENVEEDTVQIPHKGKMVSGKVVRKDPVSGEYIVDVGEYGSVRVPAHKVRQSTDEDWQKANKKDKTDGMSQKAVNAYKREHPGSKLKTAVTTKPSKLKKGSKASKRRKSYCSRSKGQMNMHNISCQKTPDKAICKARRRWNCEGVEHLDAMLAETIEKNKELNPGQYYIWTVFFDDDTSKRIKVTKDTFDPKAYYAKKNQVVIDVKYNWDKHNG